MSLSTVGKNETSELINKLKETGKRGSKQIIIEPTKCLPVWLCLVLLPLCTSTRPNNTTFPRCINISTFRGTLYKHKLLTNFHLHDQDQVQDGLSLLLPPLRGRRDPGCHILPRGWTTSTTTPKNITLQVPRVKIMTRQSVQGDRQNNNNNPHHNNDTYNYRRLLEGEVKEISCKSVMTYFAQIEQFPLSLYTN